MPKILTEESHWGDWIRRDGDGTWSWKFPGRNWVRGCKKTLEKSLDYEIENAERILARLKRQKLSFEEQCREHD